MLEGITEEQFSMVMFAPEPLWDISESGFVYYAMNDQFRILVNNPDGSLGKVITRDVARKPVEQSDRNAILSVIREQYGQFGVPAPQVEQIIQGIGFADNYPAFGLIFLGPEGTIWVQRIRSARDMAEGRKRASSSTPRTSGHPSGRSWMPRVGTWAWSPYPTDSSPLT